MPDYFDKHREVPLGDKSAREEDLRSTKATERELAHLLETELGGYFIQKEMEIFRLEFAKKTPWLTECLQTTFLDYKQGQAQKEMGVNELKKRFNSELVNLISSYTFLLLKNVSQKGAVSSALARIDQYKTVKDWGLEAYLFRLKNPDSDELPPKLKAQFRQLATNIARAK